MKKEPVLPMKSEEKHDATPRIIVSIKNGVAVVLFKPKGIAVTIFDYDVEGLDGSCLSKDPDGKACCIREWRLCEKVGHKKHWPIVKQAHGSVGARCSHKRKCPACHTEK